MNLDGVEAQSEELEPPGSDVWLPLFAFQMYDMPWSLFCRYLTAVRKWGLAEYRVGRDREVLLEMAEGTFDLMLDMEDMIDLDVVDPAIWNVIADEFKSLELRTLCNEDRDELREEPDELGASACCRNTSIRRLVGCDPGPALGYSSQPADISAGPSQLLAAYENYGKCCHGEEPAQFIVNCVCGSYREGMYLQEGAPHALIKMTKDSRASIRNRWVQEAFASTKLGLQARLPGPIIGLIAEVVGEMEELEQQPWDVRVIISE